MGGGMWLKEDGGADCRWKVIQDNVVALLEDSFQNVETRMVGVDYVVGGDRIGSTVSGYRIKFFKPLPKNSN